MEYAITKLSVLSDFIDYLHDVDNDFAIPLSRKVVIPSFAEKLLTFGNVFVVRYNSRIAACIGFYCNDFVGGVAHLPILSTKEWARGKGFARLLIKRMIEECKSNNMSIILCDSVNPHAIALYKSLGFIEYKKEGEKAFLKLQIL